MASPPQLTRVTVEDFPKDVQKWIGKLVEPVNTFMEEVNAAFTRQININQNFAGRILTITVTVESSAFVEQKLSYPRKPKAILIGDIKDETNHAPALSGALTPLWEYTQAGQIKIKDIAGLTTDGIYQITLLILEG